MSTDNINNQLVIVKKRKKILVTVLFSSVVFGIIISLLAYSYTPSDIYTLVFLVVLIILLIVVFNIRPKLLYANMQHRYILLLSLAEKPYHISETFDQRWLDNIIASGFVYFVRNNDYDVLYKVNKTAEKKVFNHDDLLEIITIFKNNSHDFYNDSVYQTYKKIWYEHTNTNHVNKQVNYQIKKYDISSQEIIDKLNEVTLFNEGKNYLITLNIGYFTNNKTLYYLHSNQYNPNKYYKYGVEKISEFIK